MKEKAAPKKDMAPDPARPVGAAGHRHRDGGRAGPCVGAVWQDYRTA